MKDADGLNDGWKALTNAMKTDTRFSIDERAGLAAVWAVLNADGETTKAQDQLVVYCMKRYCAQDGNY